MPLVDALAGLKTTLISLLTVPENYPKNITEFASKWADAYATYARQGLGALAGNPIDPPTPNPAPPPAMLPGPFEALFALQLAAIPPISPTPTPAALAIQNAVMQYWLGMPFGVGGVPTLFVTNPGFPNVVGPPTLASLLEAIFLVNSGDGVQKANAIADLLHTVTMTATMTNPGPPPIPDVIT